MDRFGLFTSAVELNPWAVGPWVGEPGIGLRTGGRPRGSCESGVSQDDDGVRAGETLGAAKEVLARGEVGNVKELVKETMAVVEGSERDKIELAIGRDEKTLYLAEMRSKRVEG
jgi:hypothetical protein